MKSGHGFKAPDSARISTGVQGFDEILNGGLTPGRLYLVEGTPGAGKTTLALQYLLEGVKCNETVLYITLSETVAEITGVATSHGWSLAGVDIHEIVPSEESLDPNEQYTFFDPSEVELGETIQAILAKVDAIKPIRVVFDSLSELRLLAGSPLKYRRQVLALKQYFSARGCTVLLLDDKSASEKDLQVQSIAHGVFLLDQQHPEYGAERRRLMVVKFRGVHYQGGYHDFIIQRGGVRIFPRLVALNFSAVEEKHYEKLSSGVPQLDALLGGGLERGTSVLIAGASGTGKSSLAGQFAAAAAARGQRAAIFAFEESSRTLLRRTDGLGINLRGPIAEGRILIRQVDPAEMSPGEFVSTVCTIADEGTDVIVIDSLNGYFNSMPNERNLAVQLHELLTYLGQRNVVTLLIGAHQGLIGTTMVTTADASYIADGIILLRYFEAAGAVHQAISVVKKRDGAHERTIREYRMSSKGIHVGEPLREFHGVLTGVPVFEGTRSSSIKEGDNGGKQNL